MIRKLRRPTSYVVVITLLGALLLSSSAASAPAGPILTGVAELALEPGTITVAGEAFTPGGEVYVGLYDQWGATLHETRWITASSTLYGSSGSADPAVGFRAGGLLNESFADLCGATLMVRAYDQQMAAWSNWLDIGSTAVAVAHYGLNGSADPALGFSLGC